MPRRRRGAYRSTADAIVEVSVRSPEGLEALIDRLNSEENGAQLRKELAKDLRGALRPAALEARGNIKAMPSMTEHDGPKLRGAIARRVNPQIRLSARRTGAAVRVPKLTNGPRGFRNAPKLTNRAKWRRQSWGREDSWANQVGKPGWFDDPMMAGFSRYKRAVSDVMERWAARLAGK